MIRLFLITCFILVINLKKSTACGYRIENRMIVNVINQTHSEFGGCICEKSYRNRTFIKSTHNAPLIALVKVTKYLFSHKAEPYPKSMEVEIIDLFKGKEDRKVLKIWGNDGNCCRSYINQFDTNKNYLMAFYPSSSEFGLADEKDGDYCILNCGTYWLDVDIDKDIAIGNIYDNLKTTNFSNLKQLIYHHIDNLSDLKQQDLNEIFQLVVDIPKLQKYYNEEVNSSSKEIYLQSTNILPVENINKVIKFGSSLKILSENEIKLKKIHNYFVLDHMVVGENGAIIKMNYNDENLKIICLLKKINFMWEIERYYIIEK